MYILGISGLYHDSAAALVKGGQVIAAAQEERVTRVRHDSRLPVSAADFCLTQAGITREQVGAVVFYEKPFVKFFDRFLLSTIATWPSSLSSFAEAVPQWMGEKLWSSYGLRKLTNFRAPLMYIQHHESHAASAFFPSPFEEAAIITADGVGEWATTTIGYGRGNDLALTQELRFPHSLGLLYSTVTAYLGFKVNSSEYKVMGLAPYGEPSMVDKFHELVDLREDGSFRLRMKYFQFHRSLKMPTCELEKLFGHSTRANEDEPLEQFHKDCARSLQAFLDEAMVRIARRAHASFPSKNLVMAGGVALNCVSNSHTLKNSPFENIWIQPAAGDAGGAVGAALMGSRQLDPQFTRSPMERVDLGPEFSDDEIADALARAGLTSHHFHDEDLLAYVAERIDQQAIVGWFQGRMEFGPRALGNRSIIADARCAENRDRVNLAIKFRESFRPFAPSVPEENVGEWFNWNGPSRFMLFTAETRKPELLPAVTHLDHSARIQTVSRATNPKFHELHKVFERRTGVPVLINTSFNVRGEPIVCTPAEAIACFLGTGLDALVMGNYVVEKRDIDEQRLLKERRHEFAPD